MLGHAVRESVIVIDPTPGNPALDLLEVEGRLTVLLSPGILTKQFVEFIADGFLGALGPERVSLAWIALNPFVQLVP
ncbi:MAG: hypothetical protein ACP5VE_13760 [Chthonomonadales bacterium]